MSTELRTPISVLLQEVLDGQYGGDVMEMALDWRIKSPTNLYRWLKHGVVPASFQYISLIAERTGRSPEDIAVLVRESQGKGLRYAVPKLERSPLNGQLAQAVAQAG